MKTRLHILQKNPTSSTHTPISNPFQPRGFGMDENSQQSTYSPQEVDLDARYEHAKRMRRNWDEISVYPYGQETIMPVQAKLSIGQPNDKYEQEADQVADKVVQKMNSPENNIQKEAAPEEEELQMKSLIQREAAPEEEELQTKSLIQREAAPEEEELQTKSLIQREAAPEEEELQMKSLIQREAAPEEEELQMKSLIQREEIKEEEQPEIQAKGENTKNPANENFEQSLNSSKGGGQPLADNVRQPMEKAFGADFSGVKIHTDSKSDQLNQQIQARAFTTGQDVFFRGGEYNPGSTDGQHLLAHELTHVVQQNGGTVQRKPLATPIITSAYQIIQKAQYAYGSANTTPHIHCYGSDSHLKIAGGKRYDLVKDGYRVEQNRLNEAFDAIREQYPQENNNVRNAVINAMRNILRNAQIRPRND
ncbi:DUF4157 domain-containing protein [Anabaena sp. FACHB-1237]|uniref:eCIS core domain-containing protein n=1 Tax=Anabaena sp. FACHB-1237 TaxID=2692769 RepID=UPI001680A9CE|nr:DUF4157 domain-containing protein [Anabaena sp. FACHB-1237]MBD2136105.1 DUF4157 domain-containing protein [Anabaena sp. FACHB-1237]